MYGEGGVGAVLIYLIDDEGQESAHELLHVLTSRGRRYAVCLAAILTPGGEPRPAAKGDPISLSFWRVEGAPPNDELLVEIQDPKEGRRVAKAWTRYVQSRKGAGGR